MESREFTEARNDPDGTALRGLWRKGRERKGMSLYRPENRSGR